jgi:hypothetical protein
MVAYEKFIDYLKSNKSFTLKPDILYDSTTVQLIEKMTEMRSKDRATDLYLQLLKCP